MTLQGAHPRGLKGRGRLAGCVATSVAERLPRVKTARVLVCGSCVLQYRCCTAAPSGNMAPRNA
eukprot:13248861-Alexandrium_andersonii.AAC.1